MVKQAQVDVAIFGGGAAGLGILNKLTRDGYNAVLIERNYLGSVQTIASQGIIHGGGKYEKRSTGAATREQRQKSIESIATMPGLWDEAIDGKEGLLPDLSNLRVLSDTCYVWFSRSSIMSPAYSFILDHLGRGKINTPIEEISTSDPRAPTELLESAKKLYKMGEKVIDPRSLISVLARPVLIRVIYADETFMENDASNVRSISLVDKTKGGQIRLIPNAVVLAAGEGSKNLLEQLNVRGELTQVRPLHMITLIGEDLPPLYAHCMDELKTALTITTHYSESGVRAWRIGGEPAEKGVNMDESELIDHVKSELSKRLPTLTVDSSLEWRTDRINRAEGKMPRGKRPANPIIKKVGGNIVYVSPTKLAFLPRVCDEALMAIQEMGIKPKGRVLDLDLSSPLRIAKAPYD